jgi:hypothetical protein
MRVRLMKKSGSNVVWLLHVGVFGLAAWRFFIYILSSFTNYILSHALSIVPISPHFPSQYTPPLKATLKGR